MTFSPKPGGTIQIGTNTIKFLGLNQDDPNSIFLNMEEGKEAIVYKVEFDHEPYALKVFFPEYQDPRLVENTAILSKYKTKAGLRTTNRTILTKQTHPKLINELPELEYAVLMPWIIGNIWGNVYSNVNGFTKHECANLAYAFLNVMCDLENSDVAHCDLSNNNFVFNNNYAIELIDLESFYTPDMPYPKPEISYGTSGYRNSWIAQQGLWGPKSDRFAFAILFSEILTWYDLNIRQSRSGNTSYFDEDEIGSNSYRFRMMKDTLGKLNTKFAGLFEQTWIAKNLDECPAIMEWYSAFFYKEAHKSKEKKHLNNNESIEENGTPSQINKNLDIQKTSEEDFGQIQKGTPAQLELSYAILTFDLNLPKGDTSSITLSNTGGSTLKGCFIPEPYLLLPESSINIEPGETSTYKIFLSKDLPKSRSKIEFRSANGLHIDTNGGLAVIGVTIKYMKNSFFP